MSILIFLVSDGVSLEGAFSLWVSLNLKSTYDVGNDFPHSYYSF